MFAFFLTHTQQQKYIHKSIRKIPLNFINQKKKVFQYFRQIQFFLLLLFISSLLFRFGFFFLHLAHIFFSSFFLFFIKIAYLNIKKNIYIFVCFSLALFLSVCLSFSLLLSYLHIKVFSYHK